MKRQGVKGDGSFCLAETRQTDRTGKGWAAKRDGSICLIGENQTDRTVPMAFS